MNWLNLIAALMFLGNSVNWLLRGWKIRSGQKAYKSWLDPQDSLNKRMGTFTILVGVALLTVSFPFIANLTFVPTVHQNILLLLACLGFLSLMFSGGLFYELKWRIERLEPKVAENEERA